MKKFLALCAVLALAWALTPATEAAAPLRSGISLQRARVINPGLRQVAAFRAVNAVRGLALGLGGFGYNRAFGLGLGYGHSAAFVQPVLAQPVIQSYSLVQPVQAITHVQAIQPVIQQQVITQAVTSGCGLGVQAVVGGGCGYGLGFRQPLLRQRLLYR